MATVYKSASVFRKAVAQQAYSHGYQQKATMFSKYHGVPEKIMTKLQNPIGGDPRDWVKHWQKRIRRKKKALQQYDEDLRANFGVDLGAAHFIVRQGGKVKFVGSDRWFQVNRFGFSTLPGQNIKAYKVEAIDAAGLGIIYDSFDMLDDLQHLKYLDISRSPNLDDWAFERIALMPSLAVLNVSKCPLITEGGLAFTHRLPKLRRLICHDMTGVKRPALLMLRLEEVLPNVFIDGLRDYTEEGAVDGEPGVEEPVLVLPSREIAEIVTQGEWTDYTALEEMWKEQDAEWEARKQGPRRLLTAGGRGGEQSRGDGEEVKQKDTDKDTGSDSEPQRTNARS